LSCHPTSGDDSEASPMMGVGEIEEVKNFCFMQEMSHVLEVSSVAGVSCDGMAGLLEGCFKRIIIETHGKGGDSLVILVGRG
jgi:hypothetical protein